MNPVLYFGCLGETGPYLFDGTPNDDVRHTKVGFVLKGIVDDVGYGRLAEQPQGKVRRFGLLGPVVNTLQGDVDIGVWTCLDWWDRTVDARPCSHSVFLKRGVFSFEYLLATGMKAWPQVASRQPVTVHL